MEVLWGRLFSCYKGSKGVIGGKKPRELLGLPVNNKLGLVFWCYGGIRD